MNTVLPISRWRMLQTWLIATPLTYVGLMALCFLEFGVASGSARSAIAETAHMATSYAGMAIVGLSALVGLAFAVS